jgi:hypothetical protein
LQQRLVKTGGRLVKYASYFWLLLAEGHLTRRLFGCSGRWCGGLRLCRCKPDRARRRRGTKPGEGGRGRRGV